jgi:hypothetical protein
MSKLWQDFSGSSQSQDPQSQKVEKGTPQNNMYTVLLSIIVSAATSVLVFWAQERRLKREFRTDFMAEAAVKKLLSYKGWEKRSFKEIKERIGGFEDDELRKILVRCGAVKFTKVEDGSEYWGLIKRNQDDV